MEETPYEDKFVATDSGKGHAKDRREISSSER